MFPIPDITDLDSAKQAAKIRLAETLTYAKHRDTCQYKELVIPNEDVSQAYIGECTCGLVALIDWTKNL